MVHFPEELENKFIVENHVGGGSYGMIYRVIKKSKIYLGNNKMYAMKVVFRSDSSNWKNIEIEMQVLSFVNPYKLHLDCFFVEGDTFYMVIDYCQNGTLLKAINRMVNKNEKFKEDEIWKYFIQICFGLECLHYNDFIHRDLHLENILLDENNNIKLADFGISRYLGTNTIQGAESVRSPRTLIGGKQTKESDIWAVGCCLYYLSTLEDPFNSDSNKSHCHRQISCEYSKNLRYFVKWCLKKKNRPTIKNILTHEFIFNKTRSLNIKIPKTSIMKKAIFKNELSACSKVNEIKNKEIESLNLKLESTLLEFNNETASQKAEIECLKAEIVRLNNIITKKDDYMEIFSLIEDLNDKEPKIAPILIEKQIIIKSRYEVLKSSKNTEPKEELRMASLAHGKYSGIQGMPVLQVYDKNRSMNKIFQWWIPTPSEIDYSRPLPRGFDFDNEDLTPYPSFWGKELERIFTDVKKIFKISKTKRFEVFDKDAIIVEEETKRKIDLESRCSIYVGILTSNNKKITVKEYYLDQRDKAKIDYISKETANAIFISNKAEMFIEFYGLYIYFNPEISEFIFGIVTERCDVDLRGALYYKPYVREWLFYEKIELYIDTLLNGFKLLHDFGITYNDIRIQNIFLKETYRGWTWKIANNIGSSFLYESCDLYSSHDASFVSQESRRPPEFLGEIKDSRFRSKALILGDKEEADVYCLGLVILELHMNLYIESYSELREMYYLPFSIDKEIEDWMMEVGWNYIKNEINTAWIKELLISMLNEDPNQRKSLCQLIKIRESYRDMI